MIRNDYRRALIMMRSLRAGISGYVRLERRTLIGTMQFTVTGAQDGETLYAMLLYQINGLWYAQMLGQLGPVRYGQSGLVYRFDPRDIEGRALEDYSLVAVASLSGEGLCDLVLAGFLNGSRPVDWQQVRQAVCESIDAQSISDRVLSEHEPGGEPVPPIDAPESAQTDEEMLQTQPTDQDERPVADDDAAQDVPDSEADVQDGESSEETAAVFGVGEVSASEETPTDEEAAENVQTSDADEAFDVPARGETAQMDVFDTPARLETGGSAGSAASELGIDVLSPWPACIEPLRSLYRTRPSCRPFEAEGFVLIEAPMASETGADYCIAGLACSDGKPKSVLYGIPARYTPQPPTGLEGYTWQGDTHSGYWVIVRPVC